jgi:hypothetical protein
MTKKPMVVAIAFATLSFAACNSGDTSTTTTDSSSTSSNETASGTDATASGAATTNSSTSTFDESASYVDLKSGKKVTVKRDASTGYVTNSETHEPMLYYYNPVSNDTFDRSGQVVNNYLIKGSDGSFTLDEARWKVKVDDDGDMKAKDGDQTKIKIDGKEPEVKIKTGDTKIKADENSYKKKVDGKVVEKRKDN